MPVYDKTCFCPSDCESTQYVFETSTAWRTPRDTSMLIKSYSKKNKLMDKVKKDIKELDALCIRYVTSPAACITRAVDMHDHHISGAPHSAINHGVCS